MPKGREIENSPPHTPTMHRATSVFTFLTSLGFGAIHAVAQTEPQHSQYRFTKHFQRVDSDDVNYDVMTLLFASSKEV